MIAMINFVLNYRIQTYLRSPSTLVDPIVQSKDNIVAERLDALIPIILVV